MTARSRPFAAILLTAGLFCPLSLAAQQAVAPDAGCVQQKGGYTCNWFSFRPVFDRAHTVGVETGQLDRPAAAQLCQLITRLGKAPVPGNQEANLTFVLSPVPPNGVDYGPMDHDLARLRVTAPGPDGRPVLLWVETLRGQGDRPWPAQVHALITQFSDRFAR